jgi:hypothetical protein
LGQLLIFEDFSDGLGDLVAIIRIYKYAGIADHFRDRTSIAGYYRCSTGHTFQRRETKTFVKGGPDQGSCPGVKISQKFVVHIPQYADAIFKMISANE